MNMLFIMLEFIITIFVFRLNSYVINKIFIEPGVTQYIQTIV